MIPAKRRVTSAPRSGRPAGRRPAIHPGEHLADELKELGLSATDLARRLGVTTVRVELILSGRCPISKLTASGLARVFGSSAEFWLNLQRRYDLRVAERAVRGGRRRLN